MATHKKELLDLDLCLIDEDPNQPRREDNPGFSEEKLNELVKSITRRGVKRV
jgi:ParB family chromosome partitioning protein